MSFIRLLLNGAFSDENTIRAVAGKEQLRLDAASYMCMVVRIPHKIDQPSSYYQKCAHIPKYCRQFLMGTGCQAQVAVDDNGECLIVWLDAASIKDLDKLIYDMERYLHKRHCKTVEIGVGNIVSNLMDLPTSCVNARYALGSPNGTVCSRVHFSKNIHLSSSNATFLDRQSIDQILASFRSGDFVSLQHQVETCAQRIRLLSFPCAGSDDPYPTSIKRMFIELAVYVLHIASDAGVQVDALLDYTDPYTYLMHLSSTPQLQEWFMGLCDKMYQGINERKKGKESIIVRKACEYIAAHLANCSLGLEMVSSAVGITASYLSALFPKEIGISFISYVNKARIDKAVLLLKETDLSANQIATEVGFNSAHYFSRIFKQQMGISPIRYRNQTSSGEISGVEN